MMNRKESRASFRVSEGGKGGRGAREREHPPEVGKPGKQMLAGEGGEDAQRDGREKAGDARRQGRPLPSALLDAKARRGRARLNDLKESAVAIFPVPRPGRGGVKAAQDAPCRPFLSHAQNEHEQNKEKTRLARQREGGCRGLHATVLGEKDISILFHIRKGYRRQGPAPAARRRPRLAFRRATRRRGGPSSACRPTRFAFPAIRFPLRRLLRLAAYPPTAGLCRIAPEARPPPGLPLLKNAILIAKNAILSLGVAVPLTPDRAFARCWN